MIHMSLAVSINSIKWGFLFVPEKPKSKVWSKERSGTPLSGCSMLRNHVRSNLGYGRLNVPLWLKGLPSEAAVLQTVFVCK